MALTSKQKKSIDVAVGAPDESPKPVSKAVAGASAMADIAVIATIDAVDPATTMALVNICKAKINEMLNALKNA